MAKAKVVVYMHSCKSNTKRFQASLVQAPEICNPHKNLINFSDVINVTPGTIDRLFEVGEANIFVKGKYLCK